MPKRFTYSSLSYFPLKKLFFARVCLLVFGVNLEWGQTYCGIPSTGLVEFITSVEFGDINNTSSSSTSSSAHEYFTDIQTNLEFGGFYTIALKGNTNGPFANHFAVFIDFTCKQYPHIDMILL